MYTGSYLARRGELETYFDRTAHDAWRRLTSDAPVGRIRATVRAGRDCMRQKLLEFLPQNMEGCRLLDAGCGTGALAVEAARRGADVIAVDLSPNLVSLARERVPQDLGRGKIEFIVGDMLDPAFGKFDHVVAMDSLIHYRGIDIAGTLAAFAPRVASSIVFTVAPRTPALSLMHAAGRLFPRGDRAPAIEPISRPALKRCMKAFPTLGSWRVVNADRVVSGFYVSEALEARRS